ncbi:glutathione peroxidase [Roseivirga sp. BDSF3-8]|uniref:glutathione peroxidase n=1 Tax=Roseivirga sp. BDSF3-8 TaxID=3241598 RepID=UPI003531AB6D
MNSIYDITLTTLDGRKTDLSTYEGKKLLIVNTASECGYTPQYEDLQSFYENYSDEVVVLGFPSNQFGGQEPGSNDQIAAFCQKNYGVEFPMFDKADVKGSDKQPLYQWLTDKDKNGWNDQEPTWNFCKYLVSEEGKLLKFYGPAVNPFDEEVLDIIEKED